ncbi:MAG TPA: bifunctional diaminohydroxyphosphoribosylaminopyrimidine deaminase/5-amino-6-(5-phosphoribosylamino)uracil reductase RibD [Casimicrobiaceae bacterium]|nr:bifunctional diaminohydroxyphosphoribosylaminopyrimidine deaminase/5-amino-6-(5-phosphoribosylamino)uracil reductase RibD [Casimicrobiaceae bacterium]
MQAATDADRVFMARALELARRGLFTTTPNPRVGCVIVRDGAVIGEGWHERPGLAHAEVAALNDVRARNSDARAATVHVTLEPCNHHGRTGPCAEALIAAGVARVVIAVRDPHAAAAGGAARLREAGIEVEVGVLETEARALNCGFFSRHERGRPWMRTKLATSLDGRTALADGTSRWITGDAARADGHAWRARACAILTGVGTVLQDDPQLTVRAVDTPRQPLRVIVDRHADTPPGAQVLTGGHALVVTAGKRNAKWPHGTQVLALPDRDGRVDLGAMVQALAARDINEVHVEAGAKLNGALLDAGLIDELLLYLAPSLIGDPARGAFERAAPLAALAGRAALAIDAIDRLGADVRIVARLVASGAG